MFKVKEISAIKVEELAFNQGDLVIGNSNQIILCLEENSSFFEGNFKGMVISPGNSRTKKGFITSTWDKAAFKQFNGSITLTQ